MERASAVELRWQTQGCHPPGTLTGFPGEGQLLATILPAPHYGTPEIKHASPISRAVWGMVVTVGGGGTLDASEKSPNPRETQKTPFLGTDESVTASVLNTMLS